VARVKRDAISSYISSLLLRIKIPSTPSRIIWSTAESGYRRQTTFGGRTALAWRNTIPRHLRKIGSRSSICPLGAASHRPKMTSGLHLRHGDHSG
jgi:hypothetical protein